MANTTWRKELTALLALHGETWDTVVSHTFTDEQLDAVFDDGYGGSEGCPFTLWTKTRVYFPCVYDGAEWVGSVFRDPNGKPTEHIGGQ